MAIVLLVADGAVLAHVAVAQSKADIDWSNIDLRVFGSSSGPLKTIVAVPAYDELHDDLFGGSVRWQIRNPFGR